MRFDLLRARVLASAFLGLFILSACVGLPASSHNVSLLPPPSELTGGSESIVYLSMRDGQPTLYRVAPDGSGPALVFQVHGDQIFDGGHISWSPAARRLAFSAVSPDRVDVYTSRPDGSDLHGVTREFKQGGTDPLWSPDGRRLLFACTGQSPQICAINEDGSDLVDLTSITGAQSAVLPAWSPDGTLIAYQSNRSGLPGIHLMNADGSEEHPLPGGISEGAQNSRPSWSPDGQRILFQSDRGGTWALYTMTPAGEDLIKVTSDESGRALDGAWSPDGQKLAFRSERADGWTLVVANADGTAPQDVTPGEGDVLSFSWAPDSRRLAYALNTGDQSDIYVIDLATQEAVNISNHPTADFAPLWIETSTEVPPP